MHKVTKYHIGGTVGSLVVLVILAIFGDFFLFLMIFYGLAFI